MIPSRQHFIPEMLAHQPLFLCLQANELQCLAQGAFEYTVPRNEFLFQKGDALQSVYVVISGQIKLCLTNQSGVETIVHMAGAGDTFGEEAVFPGLTAPVNAQAHKDSLLLVLRQTALRETMRRNPDLVDSLMARMGRRLCQLIENLETCVQRSSAQRVAHFLSQRAPEEAQSYSVELDLNKATIASQLNLAPETFSRVLKRLAKEGLINHKGRHINLVDLNSLRAYAG